MDTSIDTNLKKLLKTIYYEIAKNGGETSVSSPRFKQTEIDALITQGFITKIDASTLDGWGYLVRPTYEGEKLFTDEKNLLRDKVEKFIRQGENIGNKEAHITIGHNTLVSGPMFDKWMGEINIFNERHLKDHPLHSSIHSTYFHRQNKDSSYDDMMGHLRALEADEEFLGAAEIKNGDEKTIRSNSIVQMLIADISRCKSFLDHPSDEDYGRNIYDEITGRYDSIIPNLGNGLYQYYVDQHFYDPDISGDTLRFNLKKLMNKMETYLAVKYYENNHDERNQSKVNSVEKNGGDKIMSNKVFIVHGHDNEAKQEVARTLEKAGFEAIILHEQADGGLTIMEKIERYTDVDFAVVLYTECDKGRAKEDSVETENYRARQNVVFEHGYLIGKLGRRNVCAFVKGNVETPGDISGVVYTAMDANGAWKMQLGNNMKDAGIDVDLNKLCR